MHITPWNWRFRVGFDRQLREELSAHFQQAPDTKEVALLQTLLEQCSNFVSLDALLEFLGNHPEQAEKVLDLEEEDLLPLPSGLVARTEAKIEQIGLEDRYKQVLYDLLETARRQPDPKWHRKLFEEILGVELLGNLLPSSDIEFVPMSHASETLLHPHSFSTRARQLVDDLATRPDLRSRVGSWPDDESWEIEVREGAGWGEFWPRELTERQRDLLVLKNNTQTRRFPDFKSTIIHEVYPGHGWMYRRARKLNPPHFDHGALLFIEGWATWCDWHLWNHPTSQNSRAYRLSLLQEFDTSVFELGDRFLKLTRLFGYPDNVAEQALLARSQYPTLEFSYSLGALAFERLLEDTSPKEWFQEAASRPWGDYFRWWG